MTAGYTVEDFPWLRNRLGVGCLELDPWGSLIVAPAGDEHVVAVSFLMSQALGQLGLSPSCILADFPWKAPGGSGYTNVPDLTVLAPTGRAGDDPVDPPPPMVVEVASRSTVRTDRTRKVDDYRIGGARLYVRVEFFDPGKAAFEGTTLPPARCGPPRERSTWWWAGGRCGSI